MSDIVNYRKGNLIEYWGSLGHQYVFVEEIEVLDQETTRYLVASPYAPSKIFSAYPEQISPIFFREQHLLQLGFEHNKETKLYHSHQLTLGAFFYIEGPDWFHLTAIITNYYVLPTGFPAKPTQEQLKENAIEIPFLHVFQNYCEDNKIQMDFSRIK